MLRWWPVVGERASSVAATSRPREEQRDRDEHNDHDGDAQPVMLVNFEGGSRGLEKSVHRSSLPSNLENVVVVALNVVVIIIIIDTMLVPWHT